MTFSIVAHDPDAGLVGVAVATGALAVGRAVPWARAGVGVVATQALTSRRYGSLGLERLAGGEHPREALTALLAEDPGADERQVAIVDAHGRATAWTGGACLSACGHVVGTGFSVQGNMLASRSVVPDMADAFAGSTGALAERLLTALAAADEAGGDLRGRQSAALLVVDATATDQPWDRVPVDLRVDDGPDPVTELRRLLALQRAHEERDWAALGARAPEATQGLFRALEAVRRRDVTATESALAELRGQPRIEAVLRRMHARNVGAHRAVDRAVDRAAERSVD